MERIYKLVYKETRDRNIGIIIFDFEDKLYAKEFRSRIFEIR